MVMLICEALMGDAPIAEEGGLRLLRRLVTVLTATAILSLLAIVAVVVIRLNSAPAPLALPAEIALPEGAKLEALTRGNGFWALVITLPGGRQEIRIHDAAGGALRQIVPVRPAPAQGGG